MGILKVFPAIINGILGSTLSMVGEWVEVIIRYPWQHEYGRTMLLFMTVMCYFHVRPKIEMSDVFCFRTDILSGLRKKLYSGLHNVTSQINEIKFYLNRNVTGECVCVCVCVCAHAQ